MTRFILHWGEMGSRWGVNRTVAQIHALLYLAPGPLPADEIAETLNVARIYDCTGITSDLAAASNPIVRSLIDRGLARPDPLRIGLDVTEACAIVKGDGQPSERLYAIGPLTRGAFFEIDAIPDIRTQCAMLARNLTARAGLVAQAG